MPVTFGTLIPLGFGGVVVVVVVVLVVVVVFVVVGGPSETSSPTTEPLFALVPSAGTCEITSASVLVDGIRVIRGRNPSGVSFAVACASLSPTTRGTATVPRPLEIVRSTREPFLARPSAAGDWLRTVSLGCLDETAFVFPFSPAACSRANAFGAESPTTSGTPTITLPCALTIVTRLPLSSFVPAAGAWESTLPGCALGRTVVSTSAA